MGPAALLPFPIPKHTRDWTPSSSTMSCELLVPLNMMMSHCIEDTSANTSASLSSLCSLPFLVFCSYQGWISKINDDFKDFRACYRYRKSTATTMESLCRHSTASSTKINHSPGAHKETFLMWKGSAGLPKPLFASQPFSSIFPISEFEHANQEAFQST